MRGSRAEKKKIKKIIEEKQNCLHDTENKTFCYS